MSCKRVVKRYCWPKKILFLSNLAFFVLRPACVCVRVCECVCVCVSDFLLRAMMRSRSPAAAGVSVGELNSIHGREEKGREAGMDPPQS